METNRIAKNTVFLYIRMLVIMVISLYTSRVYLQSLGEVDFGIFNIVGGIVVMFSFVSTTMQVATQRFLNFEMGKENEKAVEEVFSNSMIIYICMSAILILIGETIGLWFLNTQMNIPEERMIAANWVYQFSLFSFVIQMLRIPYNSMIIANENMTIFAYYSIFEALIKLASAFIVIFVSFDKLIVVSGLTFLSYGIVTLMFKAYCNGKYPTSIFGWNYNRNRSRALLSFSGWSMFTGVANIGAVQGVNILLNIYCGVVVNAATGLATQVSSAINQLVSNFQVAYNPQLVKLYATNNLDDFQKLIFKASKYSFFLLMYACIPLYFCIDYILELWLGSAPIYTADFIRTVLIYTMIDGLSTPLMLAVQATGKIKNYQMLMSLFIILNFPLSYLCLHFGLSPVYTWIVRVGINILMLIVRIAYIRNLFKFNVNVYFKRVILNSVIVLLVSSILPLYFNMTLTGLPNLILVISTSLFMITISIWFIGIDNDDKKAVVKFFESRINSTKLK